MTSTTTTSSTVGPIIFSDETARRQLLEEGVVVTFRKTSRTTGDTWWRESRLGPKQGDVRVQEISVINPQNPSELEEYVEYSGFSSISAWQEAIRELNGTVPAEGHLYEVTLGE